MIINSTAHGLCPGAASAAGRPKTHKLKEQYGNQLRIFPEMQI